MMKRLLILIFIVLIFVAGCNQAIVEEDINQTILNKMKNLTETMQKVYSLEMTYEQYKNNSKDIFINPAYLDDEEIFGINGKLYTLKDLKGMSLNELQEHKRELKRTYPGPSEFTWTIHLSKVYDDPSHDWKIVFEKMIDSNIDDTSGIEGYEHYITKKYIFRNDDDKWKILGIERAGFNYSDEKAKWNGLTKEELLEQNLHYVTFQNKPVEYVEEYTFEYTLK